MPEEIIIPRGSIRTMRKDLEMTQGGKADFSVAKKSRPVAISVPLTIKKPETGRLDKKTEIKPLIREAPVQKETVSAEIKAKEQVAPNITAENFKKKQIEEEARRQAQINVAAEEVERRRIAQERIDQERRAMEKKIQEERERQERIKREAEERKKQILAEEERKKNQILAEQKRAEFENSPEGRKVVLNRRQGEIRAERISFQGEVERSARRVRNLNSAKMEILGAIKKLKLSFKEIIDGEKKIEEEARLIEEKEGQAIDPNQKKQIEEKRWKMEKRRRDLEQKRWPWDDKLKDLEKKKDNIDIEIRDANFEKEKINKRQNDLSEREEKNKMELERISIDEEIKRIEEVKNSAQTKEQEALSLLEKIEIDLSDIASREKATEDEKRDIDDQERAVKDIENRRDLEKRRWQVEEKRRDIEKQRWIIDDKAQVIRAQLRGAEERLTLVIRKEENLKNRANQIDAKLSAKQPEIKPIHPLPGDLSNEGISISGGNFSKSLEGKNNIGKNLAAVNNQLASEGVSKENQKQAIAEIENARKRIEALKREVAEARRQKSEELIKESERARQVEKESIKNDMGESPKIESKKILEEEKRRKELLSRLKSPLAGKEFGLNAGLYKTPEVNQEQGEIIKNNKSEVNNIIQGAQNNIAKPLAKKPPRSEKIWVRLFVVMFVITLLFANLTFWYWYFKIRNQTPVESPNAQITPVAETPVVPVAPVVSETPKISIPNSLIITEDEKQLAVGVAGLEKLLTDAIAESQSVGQFRRLILINESENKVLGIREFFGALGVAAPEEFYQGLDDDFTLFIFSQNEGKRLGFAVNMKDKSGFAKLITGLEPSLLNNFKNFFSLINFNNPAIVSYFRDASKITGYSGLNFRYQTLSKEDVGVCYSATSDYFIFTSSWQSMENALKRINQ